MRGVRFEKPACFSRVALKFKEVAFIMVALSQIKTFRLFLIGLVAVGLAGGIAVVNAPPAVAAENAAISMTVARFNAEVDPANPGYFWNPVNVGGSPIYLSGRGLVPSSGVTFSLDQINRCNTAATLLRSPYTSIGKIELAVNDQGVFSKSVRLPENIAERAVGVSPSCYDTPEESKFQGLWFVSIEAQFDPSSVDADTCAPELFGYVPLVKATGRLKSGFITGVGPADNGALVSLLPHQNSAVYCEYDNGTTVGSFTDPKDERLVAPGGFFDETVGAGYTEPAPAVCSAFDRSQGFC